MEFFGIVLGAMGSIASLVSLLFSLSKGKSTWTNSIALFLIMSLTATSSYFSYRYYKSTEPETIRAKKIDSLRNDARIFIKEYPSYIDYYKPGQNEGISRSALLILEMYSDLFPENYAVIKEEIESDIKYAKEHRGYSGQKDSMEAAAQAVYSIMKVMANTTSANN